MTDNTLIRLTDPDGNALWIRLDTIKAIYVEHGTTQVLVERGETFCAKETPDEIIFRLIELGRQMEFA